jgi:hypothetical protein
MKTRPDLQALVRTYGGYDKITPEAWAQWDKDQAEYMADLRAGVAYRDDDRAENDSLDTELETSACRPRSHPVFHRRQQRRRTL